MLLRPTRYECEVEIDAKPEYKSTGKVSIAMGIVGYTEQKAATPATDTAPAVDVIPPRPIWGVDLNAIMIRKVTDPKTIKTMLADALRKVAAEIEQADLGAH